MTHSIVYDHNEIKPRIKNRNITEKSTNTCKLNNATPNKPWINDVSRKIRNYFELNM